jgi:tRNA-Thr(GGU) m(6)t(6)A37 methyltransferase TsaA
MTNNSRVVFTTIGIIRSEHKLEEQTPIQPVYAQDCEGWLEVFPEFSSGLAGLEGFSHIYLLYHLHRVREVRLQAKPFLQDVKRGIFATRAPWRPNPLGMSIVELLAVEGNILRLKGVDILDGTPVLDIKPYNAGFDRYENTRNGWYEEVSQEEEKKRSRRNFEPKEHLPA